MLVKLRPGARHGLKVPWLQVLRGGSSSAPHWTQKRRIACSTYPGNITICMSLLLGHYRNRSPLDVLGLLARSENVPLKSSVQLLMLPSNDENLVRLFCLPRACIGEFYPVPIRILWFECRISAEKAT